MKETKQQHPALWSHGEDKCRRLSSKELLSGGKQLEIEHQGEIYRLRITRLGKLILTK